MRKFDKICVASWLDAEGCLGAKIRIRNGRKTFRTYLQIGNINKEIIFKLYELLPGSHVYREKNRKYFLLVLGRRKLIYILLKALLPYLIVKRREAREFIAWYRKLKDIP